MSKTFDPTKPVATRDGGYARIVDTNFQSPGGNILAVVREGGPEFPRAYFADGRYSNSGENFRSDLVNIPEKITGWLNVYSLTSDRYRNVGQLFHTRALADADASPSGRIACIQIECVEGQGL